MNYINGIPTQLIRDTIKQFLQIYLGIKPRNKTLMCIFVTNQR